MIAQLGGHDGTPVVFTEIEPLAAALYEKRIDFTVGEAVRSTCGNSHDDEENEEDHFHLSPSNHLMTL